MTQPRRTPTPREPRSPRQHRRTVFVIPHTHWDREWYEPSVRFRQRLVEVMDSVIGLLERHPDFNRFLLDGQCILLEDYLQLRPAEHERIERLARHGKLLLGPWYVLADEILSSDEALVRNLLVGTRVARSFGHRLDVGYSPDAFGHPASLPTILAGFGIRRAVMWRGYGGELGQDGDLFRWAGPDGAVVLAHHLPPAGYEVGGALPAERRKLGARWTEIRQMLLPRAGERPLLLLNGADHHAPQAGLSRVLGGLRRVAPEFRFVVGSPSDYFDALPTVDDVPNVEGELRFSYRYTWTLQGVHSTRARLKAAIAEGDRLLVRWAEPQTALAAATGHADRRSLLDAAWQDHLRNHFHDSLAGTVADEVARDVARRASHVVVQARGLADDALHDRLGQDRARARRHPERWEPSLIVVNPSAYPRSGVVETTLTVFRRQIVMGPPAPKRRPEGTSSPNPPRLLDARGAPVPLQVLDRFETYERLDSPDHYPKQDEVVAYRVALRSGTVPALGLRSYGVDEGRPKSPVADFVGAGRGRLWSAWCRLSAGAGGGFTLQVRKGKRTFEHLGLIESEGDEGDTYTFEPTLENAPAPASWSRPRVRWRGPLIAVLAREFQLGERVRGTLSVRLDAASRLIRVVVEGENRAGQHRLRVLFPLPWSVAGVPHVADMQYGPVVRTRRKYDTRDFVREWPVATAPLHRYVSVPGGLTVFPRGLFEYELRADGVLAVTLFRAVGELSREDLAARPGHAAWPAATPDAQELGPFRAELALAMDTVGPESSADRWDAIERLAEEFHAPLAGRMLRYGIDVPHSVAGPELRGRGLVFKALKPAEAIDGMVLRCVNVLDRPTRGQWALPFRGKRAFRARLDESRVADARLERKGRAIWFDAKPREVVTIVVEYGERGASSRKR